MVSLAQLVAAVGPALVPTNEAARAPVEISGIHISELRDPTPFLEGGEVLLTTGIPLLDAAVKPKDYVERLREKGVSALVIGVGPHLDEVPPQLAEQCKKAGLPLLVVPPEQLFLTITRAYWELVAASGRATLVAQLGTQMALAREAGKPDGIAGVVSLVAQAVGGWAAYVPLHGGTTVVWPETTQSLIPTLQPELRRFAERSNVGSATFPLHGYEVIAHPVGTERQVRGAFAVGVSRRPSVSDRHLILTATAVLGLRERGLGVVEDMSRAVNEAIVNLLIDDQISAAQALIATTGGSALPATVRVFASPSTDSPSREPDAASHLESILNQLVRHGFISATAAERSRPPRATTVDGITVLLISSPLASDEMPKAEPQSGTLTLTGALTEPVRLGELRATVNVALRRARLAEEGEVVSTRRTKELGDGERAADRLAAYSRAPLVETTRSYLRHRGSWEAASRELNVHRNTIRNRIRFVQDEMGIDLDDPDLSAELWIALRSRNTT
jgi:purine catabolism regulator